MVKRLTAKEIEEIRIKLMSDAEVWAEIRARDLRLKLADLRRRKR